MCGDKKQKKLENQKYIKNKYIKTKTANQINNDNQKY